MDLFNTFEKPSLTSRLMYEDLRGFPTESLLMGKMCAHKKKSVCINL